MKAGGPAFPTGLGCMDGGMTLRDWFAGQVLAGNMAFISVNIADESEPSRYAAQAYMLADAMLAEHEKEEQ